MPQANIWIKKANWDEWSAIPDKSQWINQMLKSVAAREPLNKEGKDYSLCDHGNIKGFCKAGCK